MADSRISRRDLLKGSAAGGAAAVALAGAGVVGYSIGSEEGEGSAPSAGTGTEEAAAPQPTPVAETLPAGRDVQKFVSRPDLRPPTFSFSRLSGAPEAPAAPRYLFLAPKGYPEEGPGQQGLMITTGDGRLVWFQPTSGSAEVPMDFKVQSYKGEPVLTWWQGKISPDGHGEGKGMILDRSYRQIATVQAGNGLQADLHEFLLTDEDTALVMAYVPTQADLRPLGGPQAGWVYDNVVQEIDPGSGRVLFEWRGTDHVEIGETESSLEGPEGPTGSKAHPFDYLHLNAIDLAADGDLVISARNTWSAFKVSRPDGKIVWRLGGKKSDFALGPGAQFYWQHDVRVLPEGRLSVFDNAAAPPEEPQSRGLVLKVDEAAMKVELERRFLHPARLLVPNQGSVQTLAGGWALVGWGAQPYVSLFDPDGQLAIDAQLPPGDQTYRAFADDWAGEPTDPPRVAVVPNSAGGTMLYASWNGSTELRSWRVLAGKSAGAMKSLATVPHTAFETAVVVESEGPYFSAEALDESGSPLARAEPVRGPEQS